MGSAIMRASAIVAAIREEFVPNEPGEKQFVAVLEALAEEWEEPVLAFLRTGVDAEVSVPSDEWESFLDGLPEAVQNAM